MYIFCYIIIIVPTKVSGVKVSRAIKSNRPALLVMWTVHGINERVTAYQVQCRNISSIKWQNKTISPLSTSTYLENLNLGTRYQIKVNALSDIGDSPDGSISVETTYNGTFMHTQLKDNYIILYLFQKTMHHDVFFMLQLPNIMINFL